MRPRPLPSFNSIAGPNLGSAPGSADAHSDSPPPGFVDTHLEADPLNSRTSNSGASQSDVTSHGSPNSHGWRYGNSVSGSESDFYSEDDSSDSDLEPGTHDSVVSSTSRHSRHRHGSASPHSARSERRGSFISNQSGTAKGEGIHHATSMSFIPLSYFHRSNSEAFSLRKEMHCYKEFLRHLYRCMEEDRLPWKTDFADLNKMRPPRKLKEVAGRLNLNIPYYLSNYVELFHVITMPFLLLYNTPFFLVTLLAVLMIHSVRLRKRNTRVYGDAAMVLGRPVSYRTLGHVLLIALVLLFIFFNGLRTMMWVTVLNVCFVVPHALLRKPTYFDDEDLEKCRPKMGQYAICLVILALAYLEGDPCEDEEAESRRAVERERKRLAQVLAKREAKD